jgi:hypothetical protein
MSDAVYSGSMEPFRPGSSDSVDATAREIARLRRAQRNTSAKPGLNHSAIDDGALVSTVDGQTHLVIGAQWDGTNTITQLRGVKPPQPAGVTIATTLGGAVLAWSGAFLDPQPGYTSPIVAPGDWAGLTFEVSNDVDFDAGTVRYFDISTASGGHTTVAWPTPGEMLYARARVRTAAGLYSDYSTPAGPVPAGKVGLADLAFQLEDYVAGTVIHYGPTEPAAEDVSGIGDLWLREVDAGPPPKYETWRFDGVAFRKLQDQGVTQALADAVSAQQAADSKARHFSQPERPANLAAKDKGAIWTDTDGGNLRYVWTDEIVTSTTRRNLALNPTFAADAPGLFDVGKAPRLWRRFQTGTTTNVTLETSVAGGVGGGQHVIVRAGTMGPTSEIGLIHEIPLGGIVGKVRVSVRAWVTAADTTKLPQLYIDWVNAAGSVISSARTSGSGAAGTAASPQVLVLPTATALYNIPDGAVVMRVFLLRASSATAQVNGLPASTTTLTNADVHFDQLLIEHDPPVGMGTTYFDGSTGAEDSWDAAPNLSASRRFTSTVTTGAYDWRPAPIRSGSIQAKSLIASNVVATGTVSAALLEAIMVLASVIVAGDPNGDHARMTPQGFFVYTDDPIDGIPNEVIRMGTSSNDTIGITDSTGRLVASINEAGTGTFQNMSVADSLMVRGRSLESWLGDVPAQNPGSFSGNPPGQQGGVDYGPIRAEVGVAEVNGYLVAGREYEIRVRWTGKCEGDDSVEARTYVRYTGPSAAGSDTAAAPGVGSTYVDHWLHTFHWAGRWETWENTCRFVATTTGRHRFLLSVERGAWGRSGADVGNIWLIGAHKVSMAIADLGPRRPSTGQFTQGGAGFHTFPPPPPPPPPPQNYFVELAPAGYTSYRGDNTVRPAGDGVVQGPDPSGNNGIGKGHWWFAIPHITGTITNMELYAYAEHWYYGDGGQAVMNLALINQGGPNYPAIKGDWVHTGGGGWWPRAAGRNFRLPSDWWWHFTQHAPIQDRADGIRVGPTGNFPREYGRFHGSGTRLKIWWTQ